MLINKTVLHNFCVVLGCATAFAIFTASFERAAIEADREFDVAFESIYGFSSNDFFGLGDDGFAGRWLSDEEANKRECQIYDSCNFVEVGGVTRCDHGFRLKFDLFDENSKIIGHGLTALESLTPGKLAVVEIGANSEKAFEYLLPQVIECASSEGPA
jgi:hypothetical protein